MIFLRIHGQVRSLDRLFTALLILTTLIFLTVLTNHALDAEFAFQQATIQQSMGQALPSVAMEEQ